MPHSNIQQLGNGFQQFDKLKRIDLRRSENLTSILYLSSNLESLILKGCTSLTEIYPSEQDLNKLVTLDLTDCKNLRSLPVSLQYSESLTRVFLSGCSNLKMAPKISSSMTEVLRLDGTAIEEFPLVKYSPCLFRLSLHNCSRLKSLPSIICKSLEFELSLDLSGCSKLERLPDDLGLMKFLDSITASYTAIREVPSSIVSCSHLWKLDLRGCKGGQELVDSALPLLRRLKSLSYLDLSDCQITNLPDSIGQLSSLESLFLSQNKFELVPSTIKNLVKLQTLIVSDCTSLQSLPKLPKGVEVQAYNCKSLEALPYFSLEQKLNLANCFQLDRPDFNAQVENALLEFQSKIEVQRSYVCYAHVCYPGNEIPEFFNFKSKGSSVTLELTPDILKKTQSSGFLSYVTCIVVTCRGPHTIDRSLYILFKCTAESKDGGRKEFSGYINGLGTWFDKTQLPNFKGISNHVILWWRRRRSPESPESPTDLPVKWRCGEGGIYKEGFYDRVTLNVDIYDCENIQVKKCGVKLLYPTEPDQRRRRRRRNRNGKPRN